MRVGGSQERCSAATARAAARAEREQEDSRRVKVGGKKGRCSAAIARAAARAQRGHEECRDMGGQREPDMKYAARQPQEQQQFM